MEYEKKIWTVDKLLGLIDKFNPNLIIGSSLGGYFADILGSHSGVEVLLFNPALHNRTIEYNFSPGDSNYKRRIVLGELDIVIPPTITKGIVGSSAEIIEIPGMGHRTSIEIFKEIFTTYYLNKI